MPNSSYRNTPRKHLNKGFTKKGSKAAGTDGAHKLSHRVVQARYDTLEHCRLASCPADTLPRTSAPRSRSQAKGIKSHSAGRPVTQSKPGMVKAINSSSNIRIKSKHGNRTLDERRDKRIVNAYATKSHLKEKTTARRAVQAYKGGLASSSGSGGLADVTRKLGEMAFHDGKVGRPTKIKNLAKKKF